MPELVLLRITDIEPNPVNPRKSFDQAALEELAASIREVGVLQPVVVVPAGERYRLVAGERRWRAAQLAGREEIPAIVREDLSREQEAQITLIENLQRRDLNPIEEARGLQALTRDHGWTQEALAEKLGVTQGHISNRIRLLELPEEVQDSISRGILSAAHGRALLTIKAVPAFLKEMAAEAVEEGWSSRELEERINSKIRYGKAKVLFKDTTITWENPVFDTSECEGCRYVVRITDRWADDDKKKPYCLNPKCWEKKQKEAQDLKRKQEKEKLKAKGKTLLKLDKLPSDSYVRFSSHEMSQIDRAKCEGCENRTAAEGYGGELVEICLNPECVKKQKAAAARAKAQETEAKAKEQVERLKQSQQTVDLGDLGAVSELVGVARGFWQEMINLLAPHSINSNAQTLTHRASIIPLSSLLHYWNTKNELCAEASNMPAQFGRVKITIPSQGIEFTDDEDGATHDAKLRGEGVIRLAGRLEIRTANGRITDAPPALPVYYRILARQETSVRYIYQLVGIYTESRIILIFGHASVQMRKDLWARWAKLIEALPPVPELGEVKQVENVS